jgi:putative ABC transport system permease protein
MALAVLTLAVGLGLAAALASVADAILFHPLPVDRPREIVRIYTASSGQPLGFVSNPDFEDLRGSSRTMAGMIAESQVLIAVGSTPAQMRMGLAVSANYFDVLRVAPAVGRTFRADQARQAVVVLSYSFWESRFGADRSVIGNAIQLGGTSFTIIGVAPDGFGLDRFTREDFYLPMDVYGAGLLAVAGHPLEDRARRYLKVYGRLAPGATAHQARAEFETLASRLEAQYPDANRGRRAVVLTESEARSTDRTMPALAGLLLAAAALVLSIACTNVAGLMLMRAEARAREFAVRLAIGATRAGLLVEGVIESAVLAACGGALGIPLAWAATHMLAQAATLPTDFGFAISPRIGVRIGIVMFGAAAIAAIVCGSAPLLRRIEIVAALKSRGGSSSRHWRNTLVAVQIALAAGLLASGGFLMKGIAKAGRIDPGYRTDHVLVMALDPGQVRYTEAKTRVFYGQVLDRVRRLPGVQATALAQSVPLGYTGAQRQITTGTELRTVWINIVDNGYFELMHIPIVEGRPFDQRDTAMSPPVAVVNQELARLCGVGCKFQMNGRAVDVVGIARTAKYFQLSEHPTPYLYLPYSQNYASRMVLHVEQIGTARQVIDEIRAIDAAQPVSEVRALGDYVAQGAMFNARVAVDVLGVVGLCGLALALAGLYGVISQSITRRRREIGIRMALGAKRPAVTILIVVHGIKLAAGGTTCGSIAAMLLERLLSSLVAGASGRDFSVLAAAAAVVMIASLAACLIPAWRASGVDPAAALRDE